MKHAAPDLPPDLPAYLEAWKSGATVAFALLGSYSRDDAGPFSDVDVVRFVNDDKHDSEPQTFLIGGGEGTCTDDDRAPGRGAVPRQWLVVRSTITPSQVESWFTEPGQALGVIDGLRRGRVLWDPDDVFASIQQRARRFQWTQTHQEKADQLAGKELVGWIEEVHKGLEGLRRNDIGRLLNARFGLSWGLAWVMRVQRGVLTASDNTFYDDIISAVSPESRWARLLRRAFGTTNESESGPLSLREEVQSGLLLYCETFELVKEALPQQDYPLIAATVRRIHTELEGKVEFGSLDSKSPPFPR